MASAASTAQGVALHTTGSGSGSGSAPAAASATASATIPTAAASTLMQAIGTAALAAASTSRTPANTAAPQQASSTQPSAPTAANTGVNAGAGVASISTVNLALSAALTPAPSTSSAATAPSPAPVPHLATAAVATPPAPVVFNAPLSAAPGDMVNLQGESFGASPVVTLVAPNGQTLSNLPLANVYGTGSVTFKLPSSATGALIVQVDNGQTKSALIKLNAARPYHLDAMQIAASGRFRLFGRSLMVGGVKPTVLVDGLAATVDVTKSDEHMLSLIAPATLKPSAKVTITVDNNNGAGPATLDRNIDAIAGDGSDPFGLGVGWGVAFKSMANKVVQANSDARLAKKMVCDGSTDDTAALQAGVKLVSSTGGGVLQLPSGTCRMAGGVELASNVVISGAGKDMTVISYESSNPVWGKRLELVGIKDLTFNNVRRGIESPALQNSQRLFLKNVKFQLGGGIQMFLAGNTNFVMSGSDILQPTNLQLNGPVQLAVNGGLVFTNNTIQFAHGSPNFARTHDAYVANNLISRDARGNQDSKSVVHSMAIDFAHRIAIVGNTFDVLGAPVLNKQRNDGETILTEGGGGDRTENLGTVKSASTNSLADASNPINVMPFGPGQIPENYGVAIVGGKGAGQSRRVTAYANGTLTVDSAWDVVPDTSSRYATFVWGLEKSLIKANELKANPRGIWLYQTAVREVDITDNTITDGGGIYLRSVQISNTKIFTPQSGVRIARNSISNGTRQWVSYINTTFFRTDEADFGIGMIGIDINKNTVRANLPNLKLTNEEAGGDEGYVVRVRFEGASQGRSQNQTRIIGTVLQGNKCLACNPGMVIGIGTEALVQDSNAITASLN